MRGDPVRAGLLVLLASAPAPAQVPLHLVDPRVLQEGRCRPPAAPNEVVVCGQPGGESPYRIPPELRNIGPIEDRNVSWGAQQRDLRSLERFGDQTVGPGGAFQNQRQIECEWRAARQQARGERPDCTRSELPNYGR